jgi:hypothetical protein
MDTDILIKDIIHISVINVSNDIRVDECTCNTARYIKIYKRMIQVKSFMHTHMLCDSYTNVG